jgi:hypothetical protein
MSRLLYKSSLAGDYRNGSTKKKIIEKQNQTHQSRKHEAEAE